MQIEPGYSYDVMKCFLNTLASNLGQNSFIQIKCRSSWADYKHFKSNSTFFFNIFEGWSSRYVQQVAKLSFKSSSNWAKRRIKKISKASKGAEKDWKELKKGSRRGWRWSLVSGFLILDTWPLKIATYYLTSNLIKSGSLKRYNYHRFLYIYIVILY